MKKIQKRNAEIEWTKGNQVFMISGDEFVELSNAISFGKAVLDSTGKGFYIAK